MASIDESKIREIVAQVVANLTAKGTEPAPKPAEPSPKPPSDETKPVVSGHGVFLTPEGAVEAARAAQRELLAQTFEQRKRIIEAMRHVARKHAKELAELAVAETGLGRVEHKILKNEAAANLSPGVEDIESTATTGDYGALLVERAPFGTLNAITPTTNPTSTVINNAIIMVAAGNTVVFSPHPRAAKCSLQTMIYLNDAAVEAGGPRNLLTAVGNPSMRTASALMKHEGIDAIVATGGAGVVRAALESGKKAFAAGPGNPFAAGPGTPPVLVDETADLVRAARDITAGASFDNNLLCIGEKECFVVEAVADKLIRELQNAGCYLVKPHELPLLMKTVVKDGHPNPDYIGKDAGVILEAAGIRAPRETLVAIFEAKPDHPIVMDEYLMPILPIVRTKNFDEAVEFAVKAEGGRHHTAMIHTSRLDRVKRFGQAAQVSIYVVNGPSYTCGGIGGEGFLAMTVAGRTGEGFTRPRHFTVERRMSLIGDLSIHTKSGTVR